MPFIAFLFGPLGRWLMIGLTVVAAIGGVYAKGRIDGKSAYQAKLTRELNKAIQKGDQARVDALKKFDSSKEIQDDEFERKD